VKAANKKSIRSVGFLVLASWIAAASLGIQRGTSAQPSARVSEACLNCHEDYDKGLASTAHRLSSETLDGPEARVACTDCHTGDARHYEGEPEEYPMLNPANAQAVVTANLCSACHMNSHQQNMLENNVHLNNDVSCTGCHSIHGSSHRSLLKDREASLCLSCHTGVEAQFAQSYRHPVNDEIVTCSECHLTLDAVSTELSMNGTNTACVQCHTEFQGPFPYEHQATIDYSTEEGGCLNCHEAHGSHLPRMLNQPYESPHFQLCSQCHSVPLHNMNSQHGTMTAGVACNECHTDIHGSYVSRNFFSETLQGAGCFSVGCHEF